MISYFRGFLVFSISHYTYKVVFLYGVNLLGHVHGIVWGFFFLLDHFLYYKFIMQYQIVRYITEKKNDTETDLFGNNI